MRVMDPRRLIQDRIHALVGFGSGEIDLDEGDAGLFGPGSAAWIVHGDFTAMMVGGVAALLLQMLHPAALAGVWDHSNFREDMLGRLRRTSQFISGTTYGSTYQAQRLIARVCAIHRHVSGTLPDGTPYRADDPDLLTWVHAAEAASFLAAHLRYCDPGFAPAEQSRYLKETARVAYALGAKSVPEDRAQLESYFAAVRPQLRADERTREVARILLSQAPTAGMLAPAGALMLQAGVDLLPDWALRLHGMDVHRRPLTRAGTHGIGGLIRWALRDGSARRAHRRVSRGGDRRL
jgi:uncharacterized protein (DUF2236 family)